ncbi:antiviral reverse transcriptase Drt3b [Synechococcus sp. CCY 9618]|uniref:antiviral reverse transcriptase Drt3b n=1 Tax=Synechococcus sp. CCY 9618 TaxID=2815602 RepID=UPI0027389855|nr:antiviral reverse transcriptase Drt3b [Synechococcus sp. CCY 9618]
MPKHQTQSLRDSDFLRVLLTDTTPVEVPLFFSNEGTYQWARAHRQDLRAGSWPGSELLEAFIAKLLDPHPDPKNNSPSRPYQYSVRVSPVKDRKLALPHPRNQIRWAQMYRHRHLLMVHYCQRSSWSLRAPKKAGSRTLVENSNQNIHHLKHAAAGVDLDSEHFLFRHPTSFFAYTGYRRLHKFFESEEFLGLERRYPVLWMLDISNCFGSIYTHSVSWAMKSKGVVKQHIDASANTFGGEIDREMRDANWAETNGILVGPELSRIFAEIILQDVDARAAKFIEKRRDHLSGRFVVRRYVDDYFVFAANEVVAAEVAEVVAAELETYHLSINSKKTIKLARPFITERSAAIERIKGPLAALIDTISMRSSVGADPGADLKNLSDEEAAGLPDEVREPSPKFAVVPKEIRSIHRLKAAFLKQIRAVCSSSEFGYGLVTGYLIPALSNHLIRICQVESVSDGDASKYRRCILLLVELVFFLYAVSPTVDHSTRLASSILLALSFLEYTGLRDVKLAVEEQVFRSATAFLRETAEVRPAMQGAGLETLNVVTLVGQLGAEFEIPWHILKLWVVPKGGLLSKLDYFSLITLARYSGGRKGYEDAVREVEQAIADRVRDCSKVDLEASSEVTHLVLDALSCPHFSKDFRKKLLKDSVEKLGTRKSRANAELTGAVQWLESHPWFSDWQDVSLFRSLERRQRTSVY